MASNCLWLRDPMRVAGVHPSLKSPRTRTAAAAAAAAAATTTISKKTSPNISGIVMWRPGCNCAILHLHRWLFQALSLGSKHSCNAINVPVIRISLANAVQLYNCPVHAHPLSTILVTPPHFSPLPIALIAPTPFFDLSHLSAGVQGFGNPQIGVPWRPEDQLPNNEACGRDSHLNYLLMVRRERKDISLGLIPPALHLFEPVTQSRAPA